MSFPGLPHPDPDSAVPKIPQPGQQPLSPAQLSFAELADAHYQSAYRFAFSLCGNHNDACDIAQQAFYLAYTRLEQLRDLSKLKSWLFTILLREFLRTRRRQAVHSHVSLEFADPVLPHITVDHASSLDSKTLLMALQTLDENFKVPLVLFYFEQFSYREIAAELSLPIGTVMSRLSRGKQMLRQRLEEYRVGNDQKVVQLRQPDVRENQGG